MATAIIAYLVDHVIGEHVHAPEGWTPEMDDEKPPVTADEKIPPSAPDVIKSSPSVVLDMTMCSEIDPPAAAPAAFDMEMCYEVDPPAAAPAAFDMTMCYEVDPPAAAPVPLDMCYEVDPPAAAPAPTALPMAPPTAVPKAPPVTAPPSSKPDAPKKNGWRHAPTWITNPFSESCCADCTTPVQGIDPKGDGGPTERTVLLKGKNDRASADADDLSAAKEDAPLWITVLSGTIKLVAWLAHGCMDGATLGAGRSGWPVLIGIAFPATFCATMDVAALLLALRTSGIKSPPLLAAGVLAYACTLPTGAEITLAAGANGNFMNYIGAAAAGVLAYVGIFEVSPPHVHGRFANFLYVLVFCLAAGLAYTADVVQDLALASARVRPEEVVVSNHTMGSTTYYPTRRLAAVAFT